MIDEKTAELLVERLVRRVEQANTYFLMKMGSSIKKIRNIKPSEADKLVQILKYGGNYKDILKQLSKYTDANIKDLEKIFSAYAKKDQQFYKQFYQYRKLPYIPYEKNIPLQRQVEALTNIAKNDMYNFTRTNVLGYSIKNEKGIQTFTGLRETYNQVLDEALLNVGQGKETFDSAMTRIMKEIGDSGLKTLDYVSGRSIRLDSAVRMHLKGRLRELHNENQKMYGKEFGADGVEITVHENPAPDHQEAQGKQFSNEEYDKLQNGEIAKDYDGEEITLDHDAKNGYRPISEMNCYHYIFSIILGVSKPEYSKEELEQIKDRNNKGFELDGKHYTMYEGTQLQRMLERKIREQKDIQILAKASGNMELVDEAQHKITGLTNKYKELSNVSGLPLKKDRLLVSGYRRTKTKNITSINSNNNKEKILPKIENKKTFQDLTTKLKDMKGVENPQARRLTYALDINGNKYDDFYFDNDNKLVEEIKYQQLIEKKTGYKTYLNPKPRKDGVRTADYWIEDINELWDLKGINGNSKKTIDTALNQAKGQTENIIFKQRDTNLTIEEIKSTIDDTFENDKRKHIKQIVLIDRNDNIILYYKR